jgi:hypothetical protein
MSANPIYVWLASDATQQPTSLEDVGPILQDLEKRSESAGGVLLDKPRTAAFVGLAKALMKQFAAHAFADGEAPWEHDLLKDAKEERGLVMSMEPPTSLMYADMIMRALQKQAKKFGLVVFFHDVGMVFKADGSVIPEQAQPQNELPKPSKRLSAKEVMSLVLKEAEPIFIARGFEAHFYAGASAKNSHSRSYRRDYGPLVQEFSIEIDTRGFADFSLEAWLDLRSTEQSEDFFWAKENSSRCIVRLKSVWENYLQVPLDKRAKTTVETDEERKEFARFMDACFLKTLDELQTIESFVQFKCNPPLHYRISEGSHTVLLWDVRNALYLNSVQRAGRGRKKVHYGRSDEMVVSWVLEQQVAEVSPDGWIDFTRRATPTERGFRLDHEYRIAQSELDLGRFHLSALESCLSQDASGFSVLPIDPQEPLVRRWTRNIGDFRQELRIGLAWSRDVFTESAVCYFYADKIELGYQHIGLRSRGNFAGYASMLVLISDETFKEYGCIVPVENSPWPNYIGFKRNDVFDAALYARCIQAEFIPKLNELATIENFARFIHIAEPKPKPFTREGFPPEELSLSRGSHLHFYDRSIMLAYLTNHPNLKDYQEQWPKERILFINEKGEMAPLAKQIDEILEAIAKAQA